MNTPKNPDTRLTHDEKTAMAGELAELRLRAEHGLLKRLVVQASTGGDVGEVGTALAALATSRG